MKTPWIATLIGASLVAFFAAPSYSQIVQINSDPVTGGDVSAFWIAPDSSRVFYRGDIQQDTVTNLYSSAPKAPAQIQISSTPVTGGNFAAGSFATTSDGSRVVYTGDLLVDGNSQIYSRSSTASDSQIVLNGALPASENVQSINQTALKGNDVYFRADAIAAPRTDLYRANINTASAPVLVGTATDTSREITAFLGTNASGTRAVFSGDLTTDSRLEIYSANSDGTGSQARISGANLSNFLLSTPTVSPDNSRVVYRGSFQTAGTLEVFSASTSAMDGTTEVRIGAYGTGSTIDRHIIAPDSSRVAYVGDQQATGVLEVFTTPIDSAAPVKANNTPVTNGDVTANTVTYTPDSSRLLYVGDLTQDARLELYSASATSPGTQVTVNNTPVAGGGVGTFFAITSDGMQVVFTGDLVTDNEINLFVASTSAGGTQVQLTSFTGNLDVTSTLRISPDNQYVAFVVQDSSTSHRSLWYTALDNSMTPIQLTPTTAFAPEINSLEWLPDSSGVLFLGDFGASDEVDNLYYAEVSVVPEPSVALAFVAAAAAIALARRRRR